LEILICRPLEEAKEEVVVVVQVAALPPVNGIPIIITTVTTVTDVITRNMGRIGSS
jgi:hypothetical protein